MVCAKCALAHSTSLATPSVKRRSELYFGSPSSITTSSSSSSPYRLPSSAPPRIALPSSSFSSSSSSTASSRSVLGNAGVSKSKLLSKGARGNPYAAAAAGGGAVVVGKGAAGKGKGTGTGIGIGSGSSSVVAASCRTCAKPTQQGKVLCHGCAYKSGACAGCGRGVEGGKVGIMVGKMGKTGKTGKGDVLVGGGGVVVEGRKFSSK